MKAVNLALLVKSGEIGYPSALTAPVWGYYDAAFRGQEFKFQRPYGSYVMENVLFKISFPAEFHAQTAVECAMILHHKLKEMGRSTDDIQSIRLRTQEAAMRSTCQIEIILCSSRRISLADVCLASHQQERQTSQLRVRAQHSSFQGLVLC